MEQSLVIFDGIYYFTAWADYNLLEGEEMIFVGTFRECEEEADRLNEELYPDPKTARI